MTFAAKRALALLRAGVADSRAEFRSGQEEAIRHVVQGKGRLLVVQKTGWGKSFVYFIATKLLREAGRGPALLISPLLALMRNQIAAAARMGVKAETINSDNQSRWREVEAAIRRDEADVVLISPERFANERFNSDVLPEIAHRVSLLVVVEAHCISVWGHDFRPDYRRIERTLRTLPRNVRLLATTATANNRVRGALQETLGPNLTTSRGDLARPSLARQTMRLPGQAERLAWLSDRLLDLPGSGIVYTLTIRDAEHVARWLRTRGIEAEAYTGKSGDRRPELEQALLDNKVKALVATTALGMGCDKPDLALPASWMFVKGPWEMVETTGRRRDSEEDTQTGRIRCCTERASVWRSCNWLYCSGTHHTYPPEKVNSSLTQLSDLNSCRAAVLSRPSRRRNGRTGTGRRAGRARLPGGTGWQIPAACDAPAPRWCRR